MDAVAALKPFTKYAGVVNDPDNVAEAVASAIRAATTVPCGAAAVVRPGTQVVSVSGDGGFLFSAQEMETTTRLGLNFTHVIMRDNCYDMVAFQEVLKYGRTSGVELGDYDVVQYAGAFGANGIRISSMDAFADALRHSLTQPGVTIIDVPVDYSRNTDLFAQLHDGVFQ